MYDMVHYVNYGTVLFRAVQCQTVLYSAVLYKVFIFSLTLLSLLQLAVWQTVEGWHVGIFNLIELGREHEEVSQKFRWIWILHVKSIFLS
jgi:hypothetical protein